MDYKSINQKDSPLKVFAYNQKLSVIVLYQSTLLKFPFSGSKYPRERHEHKEFNDNLI